MLKNFGIIEKNVHFPTRQIYFHATKQLCGFDNHEYDLKTNSFACRAILQVSRIR